MIHTAYPRSFAMTLGFIFVLATQKHKHGTIGCGYEGRRGDGTGNGSHGDVQTRVTTDRWGAVKSADTSGA